MTQIMINPPASEWVALAQKNQTAIYAAVDSGTFAGLDLPGLLDFRVRLIDRARTFTREAFETSRPHPHAEPLIIAAGHQPVIYHSGVARKNLTIAQVTGSDDVYGLNIIVNTDTGEGGRFAYPKCGSDTHPEIGVAQLADGGALYLSQRIKTPELLQDEFSRIRRSLEGLPGYGEGIRDNLIRAENEYVKRSALEVSIANAAVRRSFGGSDRVDEILLTDLISLPFARNFYASIIHNGKSFVARFNELLDMFRVKRKIKNHANPFPNLGFSEESVELPFWCIDREKGERHALFLRFGDNVLISRGDTLGAASDAGSLIDWSHGDRYRIAPRAMMITCLLRLFGSDLFVHGLGGARYDAFLDDFIEAYGGFAPPAFAVATETRVFCPDAVQELDRKLEILSRTREIQFHLGNYLDNGTFADEMAERLRSFWSSRQTLVGELKRLQTDKQPAAHVTQQLKQIDAEIKKELQAFFSSIDLPSEETQKVIRYREYPFFLFSQEFKE